MAPLRLCLLLVAVAAATADSSVNNGDFLSINALTKGFTNSINSQINKIRNNGASADAVNEAIKKLQDFVKQVQERLQRVEKDLAAALSQVGKTVSEKLSEVIESIIGIDIDLGGKWENFDEEASACAETLRTNVKALVDEIKTNGETCAAEHIESVRAVGAELLAIADLLQTVPAATIKSIQACLQDSTGSGLGGIFNKATCIGTQLQGGLNKLQDVPKTIYTLSKQIGTLTSQATRDQLQACASNAAAGKRKQLQLYGADLAYCIASAGAV